MPTTTGNIFIDTLAGVSWLDVGGDRNITYYFDEASLVHLWTPFESAMWQSALQQWANVANITTQRLSSSAGADLYEEWTTSSFMQANHSSSTLPAYQNLPNGSPPVTGDFSTLYAFSYWSPNGLSPGGIGYRLFVHEIGHGLGLVHPHGSEVLPGPRPVFPGVTGVSDLGTLSYNQEIYSIMSYNYGTASNSGSDTYGHAITPMAFDIAAIQSLYGPNTNYHAGADTYVLPDANGTGNGAFWQCIWDTGGIDTIRYDGRLNATIDLRAATLVNGDPIAGGAVSQAFSIFGGFTIANGVVIENAVGGSGNDTIIGNSADNVLNGNAGDDTVVYFGNRSSYAVRNLGDKIVVSGPDGTDTLFSIEHVRFADATINTVSDTLPVSWSLTGVVDLNHDGNGDLLLRHTTGAVAGWELNGPVKIADQVISPLGNDWHVAAKSDFNGDGKTDILLRHDNGWVAVWSLNGTQKAADQVVSLILNDWHVAATSDFNGDGKSDILLRHDNGTIALWTMNGGAKLADQIVSPLGNDWHITGTADFNGDGKSDILLRHDNGTLALWTMNGATKVADQVIGPQANDWHFLATAGDGKADILWRNDNGSVELWTMNGATKIADQVVSQMGNDWHYLGVGDFNADGRADILWRHDNGTVAIWEMNNGQKLADQIVSSLGNDWHFAGLTDANNDHMTDILWRHDDGTIALWEMNGTHKQVDQVVSHLGNDWVLT
jgi:hypothetical protein